jgi:acetyl esterase/lipase
VRWTIDNVHRLGGDTTRVFVIGHSAGAHTVALLALDEHYLRDAGVGPRRVRGYVSLAGPVDTAWTARDVQRLMGPREGWPATYPATHVGGDEQPLLLLHGSGDDVVTMGSSISLAQRIRARGGCAHARVYRGVNHVEIVLALAFPGANLAPVLRDVTAFVRDPRTTACATRPSSR